MATRVFLTADTEPSMRAIAAGVGIATLYRHFPTRESLVDAVYQDQVIRLISGARDLLGELPPTAAMRRWMDLFGEWIATILDAGRAAGSARTSPPGTSPPHSSAFSPWRRRPDSTPGPPACRTS
ncbi:TetR/AcrR family transcriptional regulator [Streptomyces nigra]|uniref:TetR/AcrR family transcriptional regulator n=1 Tax=Streptomyces nigra TaxID=1827580 RepID=UPI0036CCF69F